MCEVSAGKQTQHSGVRRVRWRQVPSKLCPESWDLLQIHSQALTLDSPSISFETWNAASKSQGCFLPGSHFSSTLRPQKPFQKRLQTQTHQPNSRESEIRLKTPIHQGKGLLPLSTSLACGGRVGTSCCQPDCAQCEREGQ